jgi:hypothetical protein
MHFLKLWGFGRDLMKTIKHQHPNWFKRTYSDIMGWIADKFLHQYLKWGTTFELDMEEEIDKNDN